MGVHGLWELLAPVGRRVSTETLAGKKLAIDASIWMIQFMKAMRDEKGEMVRNAHILGFFRRICKLLYLRTKPVFVFDGGTPALKRRTVIARRRQRENAQAKIRKTAEKLLLNHLRTMRAKELAADLQKQRQENDAKGKMPIIGESTNVQNPEKENDGGVSYSQEQLDGMLAASLAAEENEGSALDTSTSGADGEVFGDGDNDDEEDEEIILPEMQGKVDPTVLAALPPSLQLDLLVQMRERLMAENRQKYQKVQKAPGRFSELQIEAYLKTVAFRREIDVVQKAAAGRGIGGMQTSRIASEANREFIFSSSFTGDKQALASVGKEQGGTDQSQPPQVNMSTETDNEVLLTKNPGSMAESADVETGKSFPDDVETFLDDRGQLRVSRLRALGIRMTRDLQRNLDLMKEFNQEKEVDLAKRSERNTSGPLSDIQDNSFEKSQHREITNNNNNNNDVIKTKESAVLNGSSIEISFDDMVGHGLDNDDDDDELFACLVAGSPVIDFSVDKSATGKQSPNNDSDIEWEEGGVIEKRTENLLDGHTSDKGEVQCKGGLVDYQKFSSSSDENKIIVTEGNLQEEAHPRKLSLNSGSDVEWEGGSLMEERTANMFENSDTGDVEWEEGFQNIQESSSFPESKKTVTKGALEEEADLKEAISRSLEDVKRHRSVTDIEDDLISKTSQEMVTEPVDRGLSYEGKEGPEVEAPATDDCQPVGSMNILVTNFSKPNSAPFVDLNPDRSSSDLKILNQDVGGSGALSGNTLATSNAQPDVKGLCVTRTQPRDICSKDDSGQTLTKQVDTCRGEAVQDIGVSGFSSFTDSLSGEVLDSGSADTRSMLPGTLDDGNLGNSCAYDLLTDADGVKDLAKEKVHGNVSMENEEHIRNFSFGNDIQEHEIMKDRLEEEMLFLDKEREDLGIEHRKLERNAESVSSEMFAECQMLLQMFGLPYIIAPMEAEAQCAFMEMSNLVDGVVTDDSDAFLFGAQSVYKNIFDDRKYVETYLMKDIESELGLDREQLIRMALLLGSDYTEGVSGIGIVNAIEVVNAFPDKDGLREFREWIESPDPSILGKLDAEQGCDSKRKGSKSSEIEGNSCDQNVPEAADDGLRLKQVFMDKHRNVSKNWHIPSNFPSDAVISAYVLPQVDNSTEPFAWGKPDLHVLRKLCWEKFGWGTTKADELLLPVLKEYNKHETQLRLEAFYSFNERFAKIRSKRIKKVVKGMTRGKSSELMDELRQPKSGSGKKRKVKHSEDDEAVQLQPRVDSAVLGAAGSSNQSTAVKKRIVKRSRGGKASTRNLEQPTNVDGHLNNRTESGVRGRNSGTGRGQRSGTRRKTKNSCSAKSETCYYVESNTDRDEEIQCDRTEESQEVRKSGRIRNTVSYAVSDESDSHDTETAYSPIEGLTVEEPFADQSIGGIIGKSDGNDVCSDIGIGGSLLVDEMDQAYIMDQTNDCQMEEPLNQNQLAKDYLQFGGGFCMEEDDEMESHDHASSPNGETETDPQKSNVSESCYHETKETHEINPSARLSDTELNMTGDEDYNGRSLRAMPYLRRKKRKT